MTIRRRIVGIGDQWTGAGHVLMGNFVLTHGITANKAYYMPFYLPESFSMTHLFHISGASATGNVDLGIYDENGTRLVSTGSVAKGGTNNCHLLNATDTTLPRGKYYFAYAQNGTTTVGGWFGIQLSKLCGNLEQATAFPLPATATFAVVSHGTVPCVGMTSSGAVIL